MKIPTKFKLLGQTVEVQLNLPEDATDEQCSSSYYYLLVYEILDMMEEEKLLNNKKFVSMFSGLLHQAMTTAEAGDEIPGLVKTGPAGKTIGFNRTTVK